MQSVVKKNEVMRHPFEARSMAVARPIPLEAPVIRAVPAISSPGLLIEDYHKPLAPLIRAMQTHLRTHRMREPSPQQTVPTKCASVDLRGMHTSKNPTFGRIVYDYADISGDNTSRKRRGVWPLLS